MLAAIKPIKPIKQAVYHGLIWLTISIGELGLEELSQVKPIKPSAYVKRNSLG
jgi:hypothetical protein